MLDEDLKKKVSQDIALLKLVGMNPVIVHGGGKEISKWVGLMGKEPQFVSGLRVTDADTMEVAEMVGISQAQVSRLEKNALRVMRNYLTA